MTSQQVADKSEKSLAERLIVLTLFSLLMAIFISYFFKQQEQLKRTGFKSISHAFSASVNGIRAQWFMNDKPTQVIIKSTTAENDDTTMTIPVNTSGWVAVKSTTLPCQSIWQYVMESPLIYMNEPINSIAIKINTIEENNYCQYSLATGESFTYQTSNGKVIFKD